MAQTFYDGSGRMRTGRDWSGVRALPSIFGAVALIFGFIVRGISTYGASHQSVPDPNKSP